MYLKYHPYLIKPNNHELVRNVPRRRLLLKKRSIALAKKLQEREVQEMYWISIGKRRSGSLCTEDGEIITKSCRTMAPVVNSFCRWPEVSYGGRYSGRDISNTGSL